MAEVVERRRGQDDDAAAIRHPTGAGPLDGSRQYAAYDVALIEAGAAAAGEDEIVIGQVAARRSVPPEPARELRCDFHSAARVLGLERLPSAFAV